MLTILTPEQELALQEYTHSNVYPLRRSKVDQARELVNDILAKRDELARVLGLEEIKLEILIHSHNKNRDKVGHILTEAVEIEKNDYLREKYCSVQDGTYGNVIIEDIVRTFSIIIFGAHRR